ncbi:MAG: AAA family ATPase [Syntrophomonadaceae bacterium]
MKEIAVGTVLSLIIFLAIIGVNITPFLLFALIAAGIYFVINYQGGLNLETVGKSKARSSLVTFESIGGQDTAINELKEALHFIMNPEAINRLGIRPLKGVLLVGPPGTGKTLLARAAANFTSSAFIAASGSEFIEMYAGVGAKRIRQLFKDARKKALNKKHNSAVIFIDELEILGVKRGSNTSHMEYDQTLNQLLVEMDGINHTDTPRILVIGATNRADMIDPALLRPGRFDRQVQVSLPDKQGRIKILSIHTRNKPLEEGLTLDEIARATFGFSGAHLESLANEAAILAMRENADCIKAKHFNEAIDKVIMGEKLDKKISLAEIERVSVHESGHALVSELLIPGSVSSLTIIPRGGALGFMRKSPQDDQVLYTRDDLEIQIMVTLAGAIAEEMKYGNRSTGAKNDFTQAWNIAKEIVEAGLSSLGIVNTGEVPAAVLFKECQNIISDLDKKTFELLQDKQHLLDSISAKLISEETIDRKVFTELLH